MIGAPDVDQFVGIARLLEMIGQIHAEIGPAPIRFTDRTVLVIAKFRRPEQRQRDRLPVLGDFTLRRFENAVIDKIALAQPGLGIIRLSGSDEVRLRREAVVTYAEQRQIFADRLHHRGNGPRTKDCEPVRLRGVGIAAPKIGGQRLPDRLQIIARV